MVRVRFYPFSALRPNFQSFSDPLLGFLEWCAQGIGPETETACRRFAHVPTPICDSDPSLPVFIAFCDVHTLFYVSVLVLGSFVLVRNELIEFLRR